MSRAIHKIRGSLPIDISLTDDSIDVSNATVYTFTSQSLGVTASPREIFILVTADGVDSGDVTSVTVGGNSCTKIIGFRNSDNVAAIFQLDTDPGGTTADVVVTLPDASFRCGIGVVRVVNWATKSTHDTDSSSTAMALNIPNNGFALAVAHLSSTPTTITGLTERYDVSIEASTGMAGAFDSAMATETGRVIDFTNSASMASASFPK